MRESEAECWALALRQHGLVSRAQLLERGVSSDQVGRRLRSGAWSLVHEGVYRIGPVPDSPAQQLTAALLWFGPDAVVSHQAAAALWGMPGFEPCVELSVACRSHWRGPTFHVHAAPDLAPRDLTFRNGFRVTSAARTLFDVASLCPDDEIAVAMDDALRRRLVSLAQLRKHLFRMERRGKPGTRRFRRVLQERAQHVAGGESPPETLLRRMIQDAGLPAPQPQYEIILGSRRRLDLAYPKQKIAIEVLSREHHNDPQAVEKDASRITGLSRRGWCVLTVTPTMLDQDAQDFLDALREALTARAA